MWPNQSILLELISNWSYRLKDGGQVANGRFSLVKEEGEYHYHEDVEGYDCEKQQDQRQDCTWGVQTWDLQHSTHK